MYGEKKQKHSNTAVPLGRQAGDPRIILVLSVISFCFLRRTCPYIAYIITN